MKTFSKHYSDMCERKAVLVCLSLVLLVAASIEKYQSHTDKELGRNKEFKIQSPCRNEYQKYCLKVDECYSLVDYDVLGFTCS